MGFRIEYTEKYEGRPDYVYYSSTLYKRRGNAEKVAAARTHKCAWASITARVIAV